MNTADRAYVKRKLEELVATLRCAGEAAELAGIEWAKQPDVRRYFTGDAAIDQATIRAYVDRRFREIVERATGEIEYLNRNIVTPRRVPRVRRVA